MKHAGANARLAVLGLVLWAALTLPACERHDNGASGAAPIVRREEIPGAAVTLELSADHITTSGWVLAAWTVTHDAAFALSWPPGITSDSTTLGPWTIAERSLGSATSDGRGNFSQTLTLVLEPFLEGEYPIPALECTLRDTRPNGGLTPLRAPEISVKVISEFGTPPTTLEVSGPRELPPPPAGAARWPWMVAGVGVFAAGIGVWVWSARRARPGAEPDPALVNLLALRRAVERQDLNAITPDLIGAVLSATTANRGQPADPQQSPVTERVERWRFGGDRPSADELTHAAKITLELADRADAGGAE